MPSAVDPKLLPLLEVIARAAFEAMCQPSSIEARLAEGDAVSETLLDGSCVGEAPEHE